jgi:hypothetical protein
MDGYDKIKLYRFPVHVAIDGYSRRVLWIKVGRTNNDPAVTAKYFYNCIEELEGCPRLLRTSVFIKSRRRRRTCRRKISSIWTIHWQSKNLVFFVSVTERVHHLVDELF